MNLNKVHIRISNASVLGPEKHARLKVCVIQKNATKKPEMALAIRNAEMDLINDLQS